MDGPSRQLHHTLHKSIHDTLSTARPILTHLNADTSWLLQLPYPHGAKKIPGRSRWNILIDPWFRGAQSDVASWFSSQCHVVDSSVQSIEQLNRALENTEILARSGKISRRAKRTNFIDCVVISHEFTDHCNRQTLEEIDADVPVFAPKLAADLVKSWAHFERVIELPAFTASQNDWRKTSLDPLPHGIGISRLAEESDSLYYHSAVLIAFDLHSGMSSSHTAEAVIYSPHGIHPKSVDQLPSASPGIRTLALLHGLHDIRLSIKQLNLGGQNGLRVQRVCKAKYWISTHDEVKKASGLIAPFLYRKVWTLKEAMEQEAREEEASSDVDQIVFVDLTSGESLLLT